MMKRKLLSVLVGQAFGAAVATAVALPALAQEAPAAEAQGVGAAAPAPAPSQGVQRVTVTGSNISRANAETSAPVQVLSREDIEKSGRSTVAELLQTLSVDNQGSVPTTFGNGFAAGGSGLSMRGLGAASTLVLINGRRVAPYGLADDGQKVFTDLNLIPMEAVDRVEILKDGASSIYGSDAIAGVVNVILRQTYVGTVVKGSYGESKYHDGEDKRIALTHGFGDINEDRFNLFFNIEAGEKGAIWARDRAGREWIGTDDLRPWGYDATQALSGYITPAGDTASSSPAGNVRDPNTLRYQSLPGCAQHTTVTDQTGSGGGCLWNTQQYSQIQPSEKSANLFTRGTLKISDDMRAYGELTWYNKESESSSTPSGVSGSVGYPGGPVNNSNMSLGANHPDNPFAGSAARLRYLTWDVGPRRDTVDSTFTRFLVGLKGNTLGWDYDSGVLYSENDLTDTRRGYLRASVLRSLLNGTNAQMPGVYYRIGANANLNSAALYEILSPTIKAESKTKTTVVDFKASRELGSLPGGPVGMAVGVEYRDESSELKPVTYTDQGDIVGLGYSAYSGKRNVAAAYTEFVAPVLPGVEINGAVRGDRYSDSGNSFTPKLGAKWMPVKQLVLRGSYSTGFRAPSAAENGKGGLAFYTNVVDPVRCAAATGTADENVECAARSVAGITSPNPDLRPEKSKNYTLGTVWEPLANTSIALDFWRIKRTNEINQETTSAAIDGGHVVRDSGSLYNGAAGTGTIVAVLTNYVNSAQTTVEGFDVDAKQRFELGAYGRVTFDLNWTHLRSLKRVEQDGTEYEWAGTHGNCDVTNCMGTPADRLKFTTSWDYADWRVAAVANYRSSMKNVFAKSDTSCAASFADGTDAPSGCKIPSFTTIDVNVRWKLAKSTEMFGSVLNLFDKVAPLDPTTYGAVSYNPQDYYGAVGRYFNLGLKHKF
jgi:iron complex outermembrane receptor protein